MSDWIYRATLSKEARETPCPVCGERMDAAYFYDRSEPLDDRQRVHARCAVGFLPKSQLARHIAQMMKGELE